jgi:hypothetical protein
MTCAVTWSLLRTVSTARTGSTARPGEANLELCVLPAAGHVFSTGLGAEELVGGRSFTCEGCDDADALEKAAS